MASENKSKVSILTNGIIKENPVLRLVLGTCSCLAVTTAVSSALGMGAAFTFVALLGNHDCLGTGNQSYQKIFGNPDFSFIAGKVNFVCLNTNAATPCEMLFPFPIIVRVFF